MNGWVLFTHPLLDTQIAELENNITTGKNSERSKKLLAAINKLITEVIPSDPARKQFMQGKTVGEANKHWRRAVFFQQYRLFFRFDSRAKIIVYVWVNDDDSKRAYDSKTDAYKVFEKMLTSGHPPGDFAKLIKQSKTVRLET